MADFLSKDIKGLIDDGKEVLLPMYHEEQIEDQPLPQVNWSIKESTSVEARTSQVIENNKLFLNRKRAQIVVTQA
jgi:hypothetical protein